MESLQELAICFLFLPLLSRGTVCSAEPNFPNLGGLPEAYPVLLGEGGGQ